MADLSGYPVKDSRSSAPGAPWLVWVPLAGFSAVLVRTAWLCDDAFITFRTVDNAVNGYGLRWNVAERVQAYTHPLWMFLLAGMQGLGVDLVHAGWFVSMVLSIVAVALVAFRVADSDLSAAFAVFVLAFSRSFVDFSTSGLENPLTHLLLALFVIFVLRRGLLLASVAAGLLVLTRLDLVLLAGPLLALRAGREMRDRGLRAAIPLAAGMVPVLAWEVFSLFYYGSLVPNTALAKLGGGLSARVLVPQGLLYLENALRHDPVTAAVILAGLLLPLFTRRPEHLAMGLGLFLDVLYVVRVGGDFMEGRFLSAPFVFATMALVSAAHDLSARISPVAAFAGGALIASLGLLPPNAPPFTGADYTSRPDSGREGIVDERAYYFTHTGLLRTNRRIGPATHPGALGGRDLRERKVGMGRTWTAGMVGYYAGPNVHILDQGALGDPLLVRLPVRRDQKSRIGHFERVVPDGYLESLSSGENNLEDPALRTFYRHIRVVTRGPLLAPGRLATIWNLNRGAYDSLIDKERYGKALPPRAPREWKELSGSIEAPYQDQVVAGQLLVRGWARIPGEDLDVTVLIDGQRRPAASRIRTGRGDVALFVPELGDCSGAGYEERFEPTESDAGEHIVTVLFRSSDGRVREYPLRRFTWKP